MLAQFLETRGVSRQASRIGVLGLAGVVLGAVMFLDHFHVEESLELFYVLPVVIAATVLNLWPTLLAALTCTLARDFLTIGLAPIELALDFAMAFLAYGSAGMLVTEMSRNRRAALAAYSRLKMEEELRRRAQDQLRILVESSPAAIVTLNQRAEVLAANRAAHGMLGFDEPGSLIGVSVADHIPVFSGALLVKHAEDMHVSSTSWGKRANGSHFPVSVWFSTYQDQGERRLAGILVDVSEEVRDREHETMRYIASSNRLLAGAVAHEIRNLCSAVSVVTSNLRRRPEVAADADFGALSTLVESLARIAAFDLGNDRDPGTSRLDVTTVLEELAIVIEPDWCDIGGKIRWDVPPMLPLVHAGHHALLGVFLNVAQNSLRAVQQGGRAHLTIQATVSDERVTISMEDQGPGAEDPSKLFQPFWQSADGTGLGLYVSRAVLRGFGGEIVHVPAPQGCRFDISLLTCQADDAAGAG
jgi:two-component system, LuxR family, sensor kinase FixL